MLHWCTTFQILNFKVSAIWPSKQSFSHSIDFTFLKFPYLIIRAIILRSYWCIKPNHIWSLWEIIKVYVLKISGNTGQNLLRKTSSKFKEWLYFLNSKFFPLPARSMVNLAKFCCQMPKSNQIVKNIDLGKEVVFHWKIDFIFYLNSFVEDCGSLLLLIRGNNKSVMSRYGICIIYLFLHSVYDFLHFT